MELFCIRREMRCFVVFLTLVNAQKKVVVLRFNMCPFHLRAFAEYLQFLIKKKPLVVLKDQPLVQNIM
jgi:hypothetical protein